ncbi:MAG: Gfo/Idh/MocA family protein, partial [Armatimonadota bacterium]
MMLRMNDAYSWTGTWDRAGGGAFFDTGTHLVDLARWWFGEPKSVTASMGRLVAAPENKGDDNAVVTLEYPDLLVNLVISYSAAHEPWSERKFVYGSEGDIAAISEASVPMFYIRNGAPEIVDVEHRADWWAWSVDLALRNFVDCITEGAVPLADAEDARAALAITEAAYEAARTGCRKEI